MKNNDSLKNKVLAKIKRGEVKMRPKYQFVLKSFLYFGGVVFAFVALVYLVSFALYLLRQTGTFYLPSFGWRGIFPFLSSFPWGLALLGLVLILILEILSRNYSFVYRKPFIYSILVVVLVIGTGSFLIDRTAFHPQLHDYFQKHRVPPFRHLYEFSEKKCCDNVYFGAVVEKNEEGLQLETKQGEILTIRINTRTIRPTKRAFEEGEHVIIMGRREGNVIQAFGIRPFPKERHSFPRFPPGPLPGRLPPRPVK